MARCELSDYDGLFGFPARCAPCARNMCQQPAQGELPLGARAELHGLLGNQPLQGATHRAGEQWTNNLLKLQATRLFPPTEVRRCSLRFLLSLVSLAILLLQRMHDIKIPLSQPSLAPCPAAASLWPPPPSCWQPASRFRQVEPDKWCGIKI